MAIRQEEIKDIQIGMKELKFSLFTDDMILYRENPKYSPKKLIELINKFSKVASHIFNIQKSVVFLYTNNELSEKETKKTIPFIVESNKIKYLGINLTKMVKDLYLKRL